MIGGFDKYGRFLIAALGCVTFAACATVEEAPRPPATVVRPAPPPAKAADPSVQRLPVREVSAPARPVTLPKPPAPAPVPAAALPATPAPVPAAAPATPVPAPLAAVGEALKDKVLVSPWTVASPLLGAWVWAQDHAFVAVFRPDGTMQWGPSATGIYQLATASTILWALRTAAGQPLPMPNQQWKVEFFENGTVLVMSQGGQAYLFKRQQP